MNLDKRQKILIGALVGVLFLWQGGGVLWAIFFGPFDSRYQQIADLDRTLKTKRDAKFQLDLTERKTRNRQDRSLPPNPVVASTLYHFWLLDLANKHKFERVTVSPKRINTGVSSTATVFTKIPVTLTAECKMDQLCEFLYEFYRTDLMHKVLHLGIEGLDHRNNPTLKVAMDVEGLSLSSAKSRETLFAGKQEQSVSDVMAKKSLADYKDLIDKNHFVRGYNGPPKPIETPAPPAAPFDSAPHVYLVASVETEGQPREAWLYDRTTDKRTVLTTGKDFEIAGVKGQVLEIGPRSVKLKVKDKNWSLEVGENLKQMVELKATESTPPVTVPGTTTPEKSTPASTSTPVSAPSATTKKGAA